MRLSSRLGFGEMFDPEPVELAAPEGSFALGDRKGFDRASGEGELVRASHGGFV